MEDAERSQALTMYRLSDHQLTVKGDIWNFSNQKKTEYLVTGGDAELSLHWVVKLGETRRWPADFPAWSALLIDGYWDRWRLTHGQRAHMRAQEFEGTASVSSFYDSCESGGTLGFTRPWTGVRWSNNEHVLSSPSVKASRTLEELKDPTG